MDEPTTAAEACEWLLDTGEYHDFEVTCQGRVWKCHRMILCPRSKHFDRLCRRRFRVDRGCTVNFPDDDPDTIDMLLRHLYTLDEPCFSVEPGENLKQNLTAVKIGLKYDAVKLSNIGVMNLHSWVHQNVTPARLRPANTVAAARTVRELETIWHQDMACLDVVRKKIVDTLVVAVERNLYFPGALCQFMHDRRDFATEFEKALRLARGGVTEGDEE